ncbi:MAG: hypothetical protein PUP92_00235 [Rhizonema sp. PD38]|nr:hypothetical protein [Rhizonema sp. PD38]
MLQTIQARNVTLHDSSTKFGLQLVNDELFFREWQDNLPEISSVDKQRLDRVKESYSNLLEYPPKGEAITRDLALLLQ